MEIFIKVSWIEEPCVYYHKGKLHGRLRSEVNRVVTKEVK